MNLQSKIGFIGAGNMSTAIINGLLNNKIEAQNIYVFDVDKTKCEIFSQKGVQICESNSTLVSFCDIIFLCVKPQIFDKILPELFSEDGSKLFVSVAAGITTDYIRHGAGKNAKIIRTMPNTPLLLGQGATALCRTQNVSNEDFAKVFDIFSLLGIATELKEEQMNAIISVNGSSPAYVYLFAQAIIEGAIEQGIDGEIAKDFICQTLIGSALMLKNTSSTPQELINMVASPGGTTLEALKTLNENNFKEIIIRAMQSCTKRANELSK